MTAQRAEEALTDFNDLHRYPHDLLIPRAWGLRDTLTAYDAVYIALAEMLDARLLTCDRKLSLAPNHSATIELVSSN